MDRTVPMRMVGGTLRRSMALSKPAAGWIDAGSHSGAVDHPRHQARKWHQCKCGNDAQASGHPAVRRGRLWMRSQPGGMTGPAVEALLPSAPGATGTFVMEGGVAAAPTLEAAMGRASLSTQRSHDCNPDQGSCGAPCKQFTVDHSPCSILRFPVLLRRISSRTPPALRRPSTRACHPRAA
ncbi:conserved hypothetical protein [Stenotrophomonas maltophilia K279a]|uniref:Uncharacterized protein n=1 Tax=Stenotrophomonas maltophilia (strain K279a) TaxID=522373 RepID=B2FSX6_STRMK|nr:conserved hypothetical protein [Stenotrophomonas maltophilia K279a]